MAEGLEGKTCYLTDGRCVEVLRAPTYGEFLADLDRSGRMDKPWLIVAMLAARIIKVDGKVISYTEIEDMDAFDGYRVQSLVCRYFPSELIGDRHE
jgi:acyl-CoA synthetase (AMP-forming)/AMP-acid ligase II